MIDIQLYNVAIESWVTMVWAFKIVACKCLFQLKSLMNLSFWFRER